LLILLSLCWARSLAFTGLRFLLLDYAHSLTQLYIQKWGFEGLRVAKTIKSHLMKLDIYLTF